MDYASALQAQFGLQAWQANNIIQLIDEGNTIPFIARYRKELHGAMDDTALRTLADRLQYLRNLEKRRGEVKAAVDGQGKLVEPKGLERSMGKSVHVIDKRKLD